MDELYERNRRLNAEYMGPTGEHDHVWGQLERSHFAGTVHRKCQVQGCQFVNVLDDDDEGDED